MPQGLEPTFQELDQTSRHPANNTLTTLEQVLQKSSGPGSAGHGLPKFPSDLVGVHGAKAPALRPAWAELIFDLDWADADLDGLKVHCGEKR